MGDPTDRRSTLERVLTEIEQEAQERRSLLPSGYEEDLRRLFDELSPQGTFGGGLLRQSLKVVDERAGLDLRAPVESSRPGGSLVKRIIAKAIGWYVRFVAAQSARFAAAVARALHVVADDLDRIRDQLAMTHPEIPADVVTGTAPGAGGRWWEPVATAALSGVHGRVLRAEGPSVIEELESTPTGVLGGIVLEGSVQWLGAGACDRLVALAAGRLAEGGVILVASATPEAWSRVAPAVVADLAPGRPLHPETWAHLLARHGFGDVAVHHGGRDRRNDLAEAIAAAGASAGAASALLAALEPHVDGPEEYVVTAVAGR